MPPRWGLRALWVFTSGEVTGSQISEWVEGALGFAVVVHGDGRDVSPKRPAGVVAHFVKVTDCHHVIEKPTVSSSQHS